MSRPTFEELRALLLRAAVDEPWDALGARVGVAGETLRAFAVTPGRTMQPAKREAVERYFSAPDIPEGIRADIARAVSHARDALTVLEAVERSLARHPDAAMRDEMIATMRAAAQPSGPAASKTPAPRRRGAK